jgi:uncharacterized protein YrzB (UPF0473 family)
VQEWMEDEEALRLIDEDGEEHEFFVLDVMETDEQDYVICVPAEGPEGEAYAFRMLEEDDDTYLEIIEDDEEFARVQRMWREKVEELE